MAKQTILTIGNSYRIKGYAKSDGIVKPIITNGITNIYTGTNSTSWEGFDFEFEATDTELNFDSDFTGVVYFDSITVNELDSNGGEILETHFNLTNNDCTNEVSPYGRTLIFDDGHLVTDSYPIIEGNSYTIAFLVKINETNEDQTIFSQNASDEVAKVDLSNTTREISNSVVISSTRHYVSAGYTFDTYELFVCTVGYDGTNTTIAIYKNGSLEDSDTITGQQDSISSSIDAFIGRNYSPGTNTLGGKLTNGLWFFNAEKDSTWVSTFSSSVLALVNNDSDALAYSSLSEVDGGHYTGLDGIPLSGSVDDTIYRKYCYAKVYATFSDPSIPSIYTFIKNTFGKEAKVYSSHEYQITVELQEYFTGFERLILKKYAPVSAGVALAIINWPSP